jgi:hypothetical protein
VYYLALVPEERQGVLERNLTITDPIRIWYTKVTGDFAERTPGMALEFDVRTRKTLPDWVFPDGVRPRRKKSSKRAKTQGDAPQV